MAATRFLIAGIVLLAWSAARERPLARAPLGARVARQRDRRRAAARRRDGDGRVRRADRPIRDHRPADRDDAGLGGDPRSRLPRRATAAAGRRRHRRRVRRRGDPDRPVGVRRIRCARRARPRRDHRVADLVGERLAVRVASRACCRRQPLLATGIQMLCWRAGPGGDERRERRAVLVPPRRGLVGLARRAGLPHRGRQPRRVHRLRLAPARRAAAADRDLRLRQPGRGGDPRRRRPQRTGRSPDARGRRGHRRGRRAHRHRPRADAGSAPSRSPPRRRTAAGAPRPRPQPTP